MERYNEYKDSGVQWLGEIPSHWEVRRLNTFGLFAKGGGISRDDLQDDGKPAILYGDIYTKYNIYADNIINHISESIAEKSIRVFPGDILMTGSGETKEDIGKTIVFRGEEAYIGGDVIIFRQGKNNSAFLSYALNSQFAKDYRYRESKGEIIVHIYANNLKRLYLPIPPLEEQDVIASYLDTVTSKIDTAIAQQQKMIDLLNERKQIIINNAVTKGLNPNVKMKDSGVDWIGEIPEGWKVKKLKHVCQAFGRIGFRGYSTTDLVDEGEGCITLSPSNMRDGQMQYEKCTYLSWEKYEESPEIKIFNGDILFVKTGSTYGKSSLVDNLPLEATINPQLLVFKNFTCNNRFLARVLQTTTIKTQVEVSVIGGTIPTISQQKILNYVFPYPTEDEQEAIVAYIENKSTPINAAIKASERQISLLQERKQIIINEVVTGKVKVC
ncbi:MAG: restriction endonuclease subunit S [Paludibacteraceae bacterium]|nr:restriction endonuclease subunit S [Paludibacteraceae bacterium]